jgi:hypothetical protein
LYRHRSREFAEGGMNNAHSPNRILVTSLAGPVRSRGSVSMPSLPKQNARQGRSKKKAKSHWCKVLMTCGTLMAPTALMTVNPGERGFRAAQSRVLVGDDALHAACQEAKTDQTGASKAAVLHAHVCLIGGLGDIPWLEGTDATRCNILEHAFECDGVEGTVAGKLTSSVVAAAVRSGQLVPRR